MIGNRSRYGPSANMATRDTSACRSSTAANARGDPEEAAWLNEAAADCTTR
jgi:hypothetical protein